MEPPKRDLKILTKRWLDKAEEDFAYALFGLSVKNRSFSSLICFHFQQAAEKYLKAFLVAHNHKPPRIHVLDKLLKECTQYDTSIFELVKEAKFLDNFYTDTRYPAFVSVNITRLDAERAKEFAQKIGDFVKEKISTVPKKNH